MKTDNSKTTILIISMGFLIIFLTMEWMWAAYVSLSTGLIGIASPWLSTKIEWAWMKLAKLLSLIIPNILLTLIFFLILFPISLLSKLFSNDPLMLSNKYKSYFKEVNREMDKGSFEKIW
jgi:ABC-type microcin C transport system permease subunit YejE